MAPYNPETLRALVGSQEYGLTFRLRSRNVIYNVTGISGMPNDVSKECLECHMT